MAATLNASPEAPAPDSSISGTVSDVNTIWFADDAAYSCGMSVNPHELPVIAFDCWLVQVRRQAVAASPPNERDKHQQSL
jgi:hypothetical protein